MPPTETPLFGPHFYPLLSQRSWTPAAGRATAHRLVHGVPLLKADNPHSLIWHGTVETDVQEVCKEDGQRTFFFFFYYISVKFLDAVEWDTFVLLIRLASVFFNVSSEENDKILFLVLSNLHLHVFFLESKWRKSHTFFYIECNLIIKY